MEKARKACDLWRRLLLVDDRSKRMATMASGGAMMADNSIRQRKKELRSSIRRQLRLSSHDHLRHTEDVAIQQNIMEAPWFQESRSLCAYVSCEALREVDTSKIIHKILQEQLPVSKQLYLPRVEDKECHMRMLLVSSMLDLQPRSMNILEPTPTDESGKPRIDLMEANDPLDLILVPGLAFDKSGHRLGRGGGYYDNFLKGYMTRAKDKGWKSPLLVALAYSIQIVDEPVPVDPHDMPVDALVTASGVLPISPSALSRMSESHL